MRGVLFPSLAEMEAFLFDGCEEQPWQALQRLGSTLQAWLARCELGGRAYVGSGARVDGVVRCAGLYLGPRAVIEPTVVLVDGPVVIGPEAVLRAGAYVRGPAFIGAGAVVGHATEIKNSILLSQARAPHFAFVGDSILGHDCNLGAGTRLANLRLDGRSVRLRWQGRSIDTGMRKLGSLVGEGAQTGCNAVLNPGTVLLPGAVVGPGQVVRGTVEAAAPPTP